jgi:hypothetical protein
VFQKRPRVAFTVLFLSSAGFTGSDVKATVAAITFILTNATRYAVSHDVLNAELQQLGLPKENSDGISRPYRIHRDKLLAQASSDALRLPRLCSVASRTDYLVSTSSCGSLMPSANSASTGPAKVVHLSLGVADRSGAGFSAGKRIAAADASDKLSATSLLATYAAEKECGSASSNGTGSASHQLGKKNLKLEDALEAQAAAALRAINAGPLLAPASSNNNSQESGGATVSSSSSLAAATIKVQPDRFFNVTMSGEVAQSLLKELKIARRVLTALQASQCGGGSSGNAATSAAGGAGVASS